MACGYTSGRRVTVWLTATVASAIFVASAAAQDTYGQWEVRRGRSTDSAKAGGYPAWTVTFSGDENAPNVAMDDAEDGGKARGTILIGRRVKLEATQLVSLDFSFTSHCDMDGRRGGLELLLMHPEAWDAMSADPATPQVFASTDTQVCPGRVSAQSQVGEDVEEPIALPREHQLGLAALSARFAGREMVVAVAWTGLHSLREHAELSGVKLVTIERADATKTLFERLDLERPDMAAVREAVDREDFEAAADALVEHFRTRTSPEFPGDPRNASEHTVSASGLAEADAALENRFTGQSKYGLQKVPDNIDWAFNPTKDPEWTWQFNRHSAWRALANAYLATGDDKYAEKWVALLRDWVTENLPGTPWSWRTLEAGIRAQGWLPVYFSFIDAPAFTPMDQLAFLNSLADHAEYLLPDGHFHSGSNWGQTESLGLLHIGSFFPEFKDAATWRDTAWKRLEAEMFVQVLEDGAQVELTTSYHQGTIRGFERSAEIAMLGGATPSDEYWQRLERMYEYTMFLQKPDGTQPMLGDSWPGNTRGTVRRGADRFDRADMLYVATAGKEGQAPEQLDTQLPAAGYYVMRTDWNDPQAMYLLTDVAHRWGGGHQQPDALQVNLYAYGKTLLPDSGSYLYYGPERARFAQTNSHSTVSIDEGNQNRSEAALHRFFSSDALSFVDGSHEGYEGITHRRQVLFARPMEGVPGYFVIIDRVTGEGEHTADCNFHFLPAPLVINAESLTAQTELPDGPNLLVQGLRQDGIELQEMDSWVSFVYTEKEPRPAVRFRRVGQLPAAFITLMVPYPGDLPPTLTATEMTMEGGEGLIGVEVHGEGFRDVLFAGPEPVQVMLQGLDAPARAGLVRTRENGDPLAVVVSD